jgi:hypothetical protein
VVDGARRDRDDVVALGERSESLEHSRSNGVHVLAPESAYSARQANSPDVTSLLPPTKGVLVDTEKAGSLTNLQ